MWRPASEETAPDRIPPLQLWVAVWAGPAAFSLAFLLNMFMLRADCSPGMTAARLGIMGGALLLTLAGALLAWRHWRAVPGTVHPAAGGTPGRNRLLVAGGLLLGLLSLMALLFLLAVFVFLDPCGP